MSQIKAKVGSVAGLKTVTDDWGQRTKKLTVDVNQEKAKAIRIAHKTTRQPLAQRVHIFGEERIINENKLLTFFEELKKPISVPRNIVKPFLRIDKEDNYFPSVDNNEIERDILRMLYHVS